MNLNIRDLSSLKKTKTKKKKKKTLALSIISSSLFFSLAFSLDQAQIGPPRLKLTHWARAQTPWATTEVVPSGSISFPISLNQNPISKPMNFPLFLFV